MNKFLLTLAIVFVAHPAFAELSVPDMLDKVELKNGIGYSFVEKNFVALSTLEVAKYKNFSLEVGYAGDADGADHRLIGAVKYDLSKVEGLDLPILNMIEPEVGIYAGAGRIDVKDGLGNGNNEFDVGIAVTLINIKF